MKKIIVIMMCLCTCNAYAFNWGGGGPSVAGKANIASPTFTGDVTATGNFISSTGTGVFTTLNSNMLYSTGGSLYLNYGNSLAVVAPTIAGSDASGGNLILKSTTNATKGSITAAGLVLDGAGFANTLNVGATTTGVDDFTINPTAKTSGNFLNFKVGAGSSICRVDFNGSLYTNTIYTNNFSSTATTSTMQLQAFGGGSTNTTTTNFTGIQATGINAKTGGVQNYFTVIPIYNQASGTAANTDLLINRTETAIGSGSQRLISAGTGGGSYTELFGVSNKGLVSYGAILFASLGTPANGTFAYCSDCTVSTPSTCTLALLSSCTCAGSGTGALAKRLNGSWYCN